MKDNRVADMTRDEVIEVVEDALWVKFVWQIVVIVASIAGVGLGFVLAVLM